MESTGQILQTERKAQWKPVEPKFQTLSGQGALTLDVPDDSLLIGYQMRMQQENPVSGLLPLSCIHRDSRIMLSWRVTSLQPLSLLFERRCWTVPDMMHLVRQLYRILFRMEDLLLDEARLLLDNRFMMIDPVSMELHLAYVPLDGCCFGDNPVRQLLQRWVMGDCRLADGESGGLTKLVKLLNAPDFHWTRLETISGEWRLQENLPIQDELSQKQDFPQMKVAPPINQSAGSHEGIQKNEPLKKKDASSTRISVMRNDQAQNDGFDRKVESAILGNPYGNRLDMSIRLPWKEGIPGSRQSAGGSGKKGFARKIALQVVVLSLLAFATSEGLLRVKGVDGISAWMGISLVVMALEAFAFMRRPNEHPDEKIAANRPSAGLKEPSGPGHREPAQNVAGKLSDGIESACPNPDPVAMSDSVQDTKDTGADVAVETAIDDIKKYGHTQLLPVGNGWHLKYMHSNGRTARMDLTGMPFLLGRFRDQVDGCLENPAVGKIHAEIRETGEGLCIVDLNSRNGTRINGHRIDPYLAVPLSPGDVLRLANEELVFACDVEGILSHFQ